MKISFLQNKVNIKPCFFEKNSSSKENEKNSKNGAQSYFSYFDALKNYNIPFLANLTPPSAPREPIYAIDVCGNYQKFDSELSIASKFNLNPKSILKCANGETESLRGLVFAFASNIEELTPNGLKPDKFMIEVCSGILKEIGDSKKPSLFLDKRAVKLSDIPYERKGEIKTRCLNNPFYVMDEEGNYKKFYTQKYIADALGINKATVSKCILGKQKTINGFAMASASEIEKIDENGNCTPDLDKLKSKFDKPEGFYAIDQMGKYQKFDTPKQAHEALGASYNCILNCLLGKQNTTGNYIFIRAKELEIQKLGALIKVDVEKIEQRKGDITKGAIYLINKDEFERYESCAQAGLKLGISPSQISFCVSGGRKTVHGYAAVYANEVEFFDKDGNRIIDREKIQEIYQKSQEKEVIDVKKDGFYAISEDNEYQKFYSIKNAGKILKIQPASISACLKGRNRSAGGYVFALSRDVEFEDEDGVFKADIKKIAQKAQQLAGKPFYAIDKNGEYQRFLNQKDAASILSVPIKSISECLSGRIKTTNGYAFLYASDIEINNDNGEIGLNQDLVDEIVREFNKHALYAIDKEGNYQKFANGVQAAEALGVDKGNIASCLSGRAKTTGGYAFVRAFDVEIRQEEGKIIVDEEKIREKMKVFKKK